MKLTVVGDPHAKPSNLANIEQLFTLIESLGNTTVLLGDLLDTKELVRGSCLNTYIRLMGQSKLEFIVLVGNHDWFNLDCKEHALEALKLLPNVTVVDKYTRLHGCAFMPFTVSGDKATFNWDTVAITKEPLFGHFDIPGFDYGNGHISDHGVDESNFQTTPIVISGHYHKFQDKNNIVYLGTPFSHSFGEANQEKYIGVFDTETHQLELIKTNLPTHLSFDITDYTEIPELLKNVSSKDYVRINLSGTPEYLNSFDSSQYPNIKFVYKYISTETSQVKIDTKLSNEQQFQYWAKEIGNLTEKTIGLGLEVLKQCHSSQK